MQDLSREEKQTLRREMRKQALELKAWWLQEMTVTASPLTEVMTLFWHNHFTSSLKKVKAPVLMYRQNRLLRQEAVGNFARLLRAVARDPAMLIYLDGPAAVKPHRTKTSHGSFSSSSPSVKATIRKRT